jgi:hypothetical protein
VAKRLDRRVVKEPGRVVEELERVVEELKIYGFF